MTPYTVYDPATGLILRSGMCQPDMINLQPRSGEAVIEGAWPDDETYIDADAQPVALPPCPDPAHSFDRHTQEWVDLRSPSDLALELELARARAMSQLHGAVSAVRLTYITDIPGQEMIYLRKEAEARAWLAALLPPNLSDYPMLSAEVGITAPDADALAQVWLNMAQLMTYAAAALEHIRLSAAAAIQAATSASEIDATLIEVAAQIEALT